MRVFCEFGEVCARTSPNSTGLLEILIIQQWRGKDGYCKVIRVPF